LLVLGARFDFERDDQLGYLTSCPTNIGTAMRAGVHIQLRHLQKHPQQLRAIADKYDLQIRGTQGEKTKVEDGVFDISNRSRFGVSEVQIAETLHRGVLAIIEAEKGLEMSQGYG